MRAALYARVSTADKDQNPDTQLLALRDHVARQGWTVTREYVDRASARDIVRRVAWREMMEDAHHHRFDVLVVWKLDRAFRSVVHARSAIDSLTLWGIRFKAVTQNIETVTAAGSLFMTILAAFAEFELETIRERVNAGIDRARREGKALGRARVPVDVGRLLDAYSRPLSVRGAARELGITPGVAWDRLSKMGALRRKEAQ